MKALIAVAISALSGVAMAGDVPPGYAGVGGMTLQEIDPAIYAYHYDHGFVGEDAMGWDPALQFAWSRIAAAKVCGQQPVEQEAIVAKLVAQYGQDAVVHQINGIEFHEVQMRASSAFCTATRGAEAVAVVPAFATGDFSTATAYAAAAAAGTVLVAATEEQPASQTQGDALIASSADWALQLPLHASMRVGSNGLPNGDEMLRVVRRGHTGAVVGLQIATSLFARGIAVSSFGKGQLKGEKMEAVGNPGYQLQRDAVNARLKSYFTGHPAALPVDPFPLQVLMSDWLLVYQSLADTTSPYELRYAVTIGGERSGLLKRKASPVNLDCAPTPRTASLEQWEANDYALVKEAARAYSEECAAKFAEQLPQWFPDREAVAASN
ncbi:hypothetical protein [Xanthomonas hortorum]|uniref:Lipoprotein n=1 Tax=Xanthomonas hortorum pv. pelargonii TaxID=453602 RepID=A0A6V7EMB4_9XANT|nr:hypothetical protein [Xanthomonas hortorum]MCE4352526.1 hypothetical protein [Xanthomonas hortorum pv. pelargonii]MCM5525181.1 hypothetical protein [Xanthomonas hortorum pv. pelargonii]MCM5535222.1 hypothetical protein [Xanthomonas hortorum pv. pelargonii]MCM5539090.1 hypothetical protein [Xanthomonas hortorum pv. pelargonii]MCM5543054.1 hypothetical protein [Xanthomonas hortorum pv. pelargonii]